MERTEAVKKVLQIYGETDRYITQRFYQSLCIEALDLIKSLQADNVKLKAALYDKEMADANDQTTV